MRRLEVRTWVLVEQARRKLFSGNPLLLEPVEDCGKPGRVGLHRATSPPLQESRLPFPGPGNLRCEETSMPPPRSSSRRSWGHWEPRTRKPGRWGSSANRVPKAAQRSLSAPHRCQAWRLPHSASLSGWNQSLCSGMQGWVPCTLCGPATPNWTS